MVAHIFNYNTWEVDLWVHGQHALQSQIQDNKDYTEKACHMQKNKNKNKMKLWILDTSKCSATSLIRNWNGVEPLLHITPHISPTEPAAIVRHMFVAWYATTWPQASASFQAKGKPGI